LTTTRSGATSITRSRSI